MASMKYCDKHNQVGFLKKPEESTGFAEIVDFFLKVRKSSKLQLADASGISMLPNTEIFEGMGNMGYPTDGFVSTARPSISTTRPVSTARPSINTARPVCTARPSINTARPVYASRPIYLRMDNVRPRGLCSPIKRSYYTKPAFRTKDLKQEVNIFGVKNMTTDGKKAVVNTGKGQSRDLTMKITIEALWLLEGIPKAVLTLVKMVKIMEKALKRKTHKVVISESEGEEPEDHGRIIQDIDDDPLVFLVRESMKMKEKSTDFFTPTKDSGEAQEEEISPTILEAANTLSKVASHGGSKVKSTDKGKRYRRKARSLAKNINIGLDVEEEINIGIKDVNTGSTKVDSGTASKRGQRKGKNPVVEEDIQATHKTKEQIRQEEAGLEEAIKEEALSEQQKKKKAKVQFEAQFYTEEDWDAIRAKLEANAELTKDVLGKDLHEQDFAKRMVEMNQGTWKLSQLKKLKFEEIKEEFDKLVQQIDTFVPINLEATKSKLKRYREEIQIKTSKKQRFDDKEVPDIGEKVAEVKEEEQVKRTGKRNKQKAR
ncbi:hypothetical protein Tco_0635375, partial [Tanacetum coccineum]